MTSAMPFGLKIAILNRTFRKKMDEKAAGMGLTSVQLRVLRSISRLEAASVEEIHQNDLEKLEHVTHPAMTKLLQRLEAKGFVHCEPGRTDRRCKRVCSTAKSAGIHARILTQDAQTFRELCRDFSPEEQAQLERLIDRMLRGIDR